jgi:isochorismate hydrolase
MARGLIIIDMVKSYRLDTYNVKEILNNQIKLIDAFNKHKLPVIVVTGDPKAKPNPVMVRIWGNEAKKYKKKGLNKLVPEIAEAKYNKLIKKSQYDAFFKTDLERYCKNKKIDKLYFCGVYSGVCVYFSGAGAAMRRIQPYLVTDASSTESLKLHKKNCIDFKEIIGQLITTKELLKEISR